MTTISEAGVVQQGGGGLVSLLPFAALALVLHLGAFAVIMPGSSADGGGGGSAPVTLQGASPGMAETVARWTRPPSVAAPPEPGPAPAEPRAAALPEAPASEPATHRPALPDMPRSAPAPSLPAEAPAEPAPPLPLPRIGAPTIPAPIPAPMTDQSPDRAEGDSPALPPAQALPASPSPSPSPSPLPPLAATRLPTSPAQGATASPAPPPVITTPPGPAEAAPERGRAPSRSPQPEARPQTRTEARPEPVPASPAPSTATAPPPAAPPSAPPSAAAPSARAAGEGARAREGQQGRAETTSRAGADSAALVAQWGGAIRAAVQRQQRHPRGVRGGGVVHVQLAVNASGQLSTVQVTRSSGQEALDRAALEAVRRARLPRAPQGVSGTHRFNLPMRFQG